MSKASKPRRGLDAPADGQVGVPERSANGRRACIVTDNAGLVKAFGRVVFEALGHAPVHAPHVAWRDDQLRVEGFSWLFIDLDAADAWQRLADVCGDDEQAGHAACCRVGVVKEGCPLEHLELADRGLFRTLVWPLDDGRLGDALKEIVQASQGNGWRQNHGARVLEGSTHVFTTRTAALFPVVEALRVVGRHNYNILLTGETGTGKTTLARLLHEISPRRKARLLTVSCGALPNELMGSELFGHVRGAFTGADRNKVGKFEVVDKGTLVLEEIDTLDLIQQAKLLRVLECGEFEPLGSNETRRVDVRLIATSNVDLEALVAAGRFRADLYFRLTQLKFELPPLRQRPSDLAHLTGRMIADCCRENGLNVERVHPEFLELLKAYAWPGNIRELHNEVHRAVLFCRQGLLTAECLPTPLVRAAREARQHADGQPVQSDLAKDLARAEVEAIERMLRSTDFNRAATARALGISRVTLYNKIRRYRIPLEDGGGPRR